MARTNVCIPCVFEFQGYVTGHHAYKNIWAPTLGEKLSTTTKIITTSMWSYMFPVIFQCILPPQFCVGGL